MKSIDNEKTLLPEKRAKIKLFIERSCSFLAAVILLQTLYFKFSAAPESIFIFSRLHVEPWGRIGTGIIELLAGILLLFRKTSILGAILGAGVITGAVFAHIFILGIEIAGDGGYLFLLAVLVLILCLISILMQRDKIAVFIGRAMRKVSRKNNL